MSISESYNAWSTTYDAMPNKTRDLDKLATQRVLADYNFEHILECGCGTGKNSLWLMTKSKQLTGLDFSEKMLAKAKEKIQSSQVNFIQTDLNNPWPVQANAADLVTLNLVLEHINDLDHIFKQARQSLQKNGLLFICELHPFKQYKGSKARFHNGQEEQVLEVYTHHVSEYLGQAKTNGFQLLQLNEWFDEPEAGEIPRLISFLFQNGKK